MNIKKFLNRLFFEKKVIYLMSSSRVTVESGGVFRKGKNVTIKNSNIYVKKGDTLIIGDDTSIIDSNLNMIVGKESKIEIGRHCIINQFNLGLSNGNIKIGDNNFIEKGGQSDLPFFEVEGDLSIGDYNRIRCNIWIRFNGSVSIGSRNAINERTEIRCDDKVEIGDYNQISYDCVIWDTNTHNIYKAEKRRDITDKQYPDFGLEFEKPKTQPIFIGSDCWIGRDVSILKGSEINNKCILGYGVLVSNVSVEDNKTVINQPSLKVIDNKL
ncbi:hypothetical protein MHTCC0001_33710 [Flavobacteriaceae bacterium MHTCC 0001]